MLRKSAKGSDTVEAVWLTRETENVIHSRYGKSSITSRAVILFMVSYWENHKLVMVKTSEDSKS